MTNHLNFKKSSSDVIIVFATSKKQGIALTLIGPAIKALTCPVQMAKDLRVTNNIKCLNLLHSDVINILTICMT